MIGCIYRNFYSIPKPQVKTCRCLDVVKATYTYSIIIDIVKYFLRGEKTAKLLKFAKKNEFCFSVLHQKKIAIWMVFQDEFLDSEKVIHAKIFSMLISKDRCRNLIWYWKRWNFFRRGVRSSGKNILDFKKVNFCYWFLKSFKIKLQSIK